MNNVTMSRLQYDDTVIFLRDWADGKVLLTSADEDVKRTWRRINERQPKAVQMLVDRDDLTDEDMEGTVSVIMDPEWMEIGIDPRDHTLAFYVEEDDDE